MFDMTEDGLTEVPDPSQTILSQRYHEAIGTALVPVMEGTTPILMEVQALTSPSYGPIPRRVANGVDYNRLLMLSAVSAKRAGLSLHNQDIIINIAGGFKITEPAADMGIIMAIASSLYNQSLGPDLAVFGEVGLSGELRQVHQSDRRITEVSRLGLSQCILPTLLEQANPTDINLIACRTITDAINKTMKNRTNN
jgi:DNA repair protein RadA/Sms